MKRCLCLGLLTLPVLASAVDVIKMADGTTVQCTVISYSGGRFNIEDTNSIRRVDTKAILAIYFDVTPEDTEPTTKPEQATFQPPDVSTYKAAGPFPLETVNLFPQKYVGTLLVFDQCRVSQELNPTTIKGLFGLVVTSPGGTLLTGLPGSDRIAFCVGTTMADKMSRYIGGRYEWPWCRISCAIMKVHDDYIAFVTELTAYHRSGKPSLTFRADGTAMDMEGIDSRLHNDADAKLRAEWEATSPIVKLHYQTFENWLNKTKSKPTP